jgi:hypothetical protein
MLLTDMSNIVTITDGVNSHRILLLSRLHPRTNFQPVQSVFLHYDLVFYSIEMELNFVRRKASCGLQESFRLHPRPISSVYEVRSCTIN